MSQASRVRPGRASLAARMAGSQGGFTLIEVLVALIILGVGMYAAIAIFPTGFAAMEYNRNVTKAARLADGEIQRWKARAASLPEAIVAQDAAGAVQVDYSLDRLEFDSANPNWQPNATWAPRTIVGETIVIPSPRGGAQHEVPLYVLTMSPLDHDNPRLVVYSTPYQEVTSESELATDGDHQQFYVVPTLQPGVDGPHIHLKLDTVPDTDPGDPNIPPPRSVRVDYSYYRARRSSGGDIVSQEVVQVLGELHDNIAAGTNEVILLNGANAAERADVQGVVPGSVKVYEAFTQVANPTNSGEFGIADREGTPTGFGLVTGVLRFAPADAGRTVRVDYQVADWQILRQEQTPTRNVGANGDVRYTITVLGAPIRRFSDLRPPRSPDPVYLDSIPGVGYVDVVAVNLDTGRALYGSDQVTERTPGPADPNPYYGTFRVDYLNGVCVLAENGVGNDRLGHPWRIMYRSLDDWTVQVSKAAEAYVPDTWASGRADQQYGTGVTYNADTRVLTATFTFARAITPGGVRCSEAGKMVVMDYTYGYTDSGGAYRRAMVHGALHRIPEDGQLVITHQLPAGATLVTYDDGTVDFTVNSVRGASLRARAIWIGKGASTAEGGEPVNERMFPQDIETFLTRSQ